MNFIYCFGYFLFVSFLIFDRVGLFNSSGSSCTGSVYLADFDLRVLPASTSLTLGCRPAPAPSGKLHFVCVLVCFVVLRQGFFV